VTTEHKIADPEFNNCLREIARGNESAFKFMLFIAEISNFWDDLIDRDVKLSDEEINAAMWTAMIELPRNEFYVTHFNELNSVMATGMQTWFVSTQFEREGGHYAAAAYTLRSSYMNIFSMVALLCGGYTHARIMTPDICKLAFREDYQKYLLNLSTEIDNRTKGV
jgi:hypothetical protein